MPKQQHGRTPPPRPTLDQRVAAQQAAVLAHPTLGPKAVAAVQAGGAEAQRAEHAMQTAVGQELHTAAMAFYAMLGSNDLLSEVINLDPQMVYALIGLLHSKQPAAQLWGCYQLTTLLHNRAPHIGGSVAAQLHARLRALLAV